MYVHVANSGIALLYLFLEFGLGEHVARTPQPILTYPDMVIFFSSFTSALWYGLLDFLLKVGGRPRSCKWMDELTKDLTIWLVGSRTSRGSTTAWLLRQGVML